jgi:hypothetical protein
LRKRHAPFVPVVEAGGVAGVEIGVTGFGAGGVLASGVVGRTGFDGSGLRLTGMENFAVVASSPYHTGVRVSRRPATSAGDWLRRC